MKVLVVGSGGREHALAWKLARSPRVEKVYVAPGNAGTAGEDKIINLPADENDPYGVCNVARDQRVDLTIVGPEFPLSVGIVDLFKECGLPIFGPTKGATQIESSKSFCKDFMRRYGVPTADYHKFDDIEKATQWLKSCALPVVVKADGLAGGKGVVVAHDRETAINAAQAMLSGKAFGMAGCCIVVEDFVVGEELSLICVVDGKTALPLASSQDHKARDEGDKGPNTGGMGAYSPAPLCTEPLLERAMDEVIKPMVSGLATEGSPFEGFLYAGLMVKPDGQLCVLEFNCRMGDPEAQPILMRMKTDFVELLENALTKNLHKQVLEWDPRSALTIVMATQGYPQDYDKSLSIKGLEAVDSDTVKVFHAGTRLSDNCQIVTDGGRVLGVTALGESLREAQKIALETCQRITWKGSFYRKDIGFKAIDFSP